MQTRPRARRRGLEQASNAMTGCTVRVKHYRRTPTTDDAVRHEPGINSAGHASRRRSCADTGNGYQAPARRRHSNLQISSPTIASAYLTRRRWPRSHEQTRRRTMRVRQPLPQVKRVLFKIWQHSPEGRFAAEYFPRYNRRLLRLSGKDLSGDDVDALVDLIKHVLHLDPARSAPLQRRSSRAAWRSPRP